MKDKKLLKKIVDEIIFRLNSNSEDLENIVHCYRDEIRDDIEYVLNNNIKDDGL
jgi:hypothetical protein